jgi:hypothetical protein
LWQSSQPHTCKTNSYSSQKGIKALLFPSANSSSRGISFAAGWSWQSFADIKETKQKQGERAHFDTILMLLRMQSNLENIAIYQYIKWMQKLIQKNEQKLLQNFGMHKTFLALFPRRVMRGFEVQVYKPVAVVRTVFTGLQCLTN